jgi:hypothetical protein
VAANAIKQPPVGGYAHDCFARRSLARLTIGLATNRVLADSGVGRSLDDRSGQAVATDLVAEVVRQQSRSRAATGPRSWPLPTRSSDVVPSENVAAFGGNEKPEFRRLVVL